MDSPVSTHVLLLLRHAKAATVVPGRGDQDRPLTDEGRAQAAEVAATLEGAGVDLALCSPAVRTRQTLEALNLACPVDVSAALYNAGSDTILDELHLVDEHVTTALVVGHAPGIPALANDLADPDTSDPQALATLRERYPTATLTRFEFDEPWARLRTARLTLTRLG